MKQLSTFFLLSFLAPTAIAQPVFIDVGAATTQAPGSAGSVLDANTFTSVFNQLQLFADTSTTQFNTNLGGVSGLNVGDRFVDTGNAAITDLLPPFGDDEGLGSFSEITVDWSGLSGITTSDLTTIGVNGETVQTIAYDSNSTILSFYFHGDAGATNADFGTVGIGDNTGFTDGEKVLDLLVKGGSGTNTFSSSGEFLSGSSLLLGEIVFALNDFWWFDNGDDIAGTPGDQDFNSLLGLAVPLVLKASIDQNTDNVETDFSGLGTPGPVGFGDQLFVVNSTHDGSLDFEVPAPKTLLLLGLGLVLFPWLRRRPLAKARIHKHQ